MSTDGNFTPATIPECPYDPRMTRAQALALRAAAGLRENCVVVITDGPVIGTAGNTSPTEIELNPVSATELGTAARVNTTFDDSAWAGQYDIDLGAAGSITWLEDSSGNVAVDLDADSPTVHTQFPWHLGATLGGVWRDNYVEDTVFTAADAVVAPMAVTNSRFVNTTMDFTGWLSGTMSLNTIEGGGTHRISGTFATWSNSRIRGGSTVNGVGRITLTNAEIDGTAQLLNPAGSTGVLSVSNSKINGSTLTVTDTGNITVSAGSDVINGSVMTTDAATPKAMSITGTVVDGATLRTTGAGTGGLTFSACRVYGRPSAAPLDSILLQGAGATGGVSYQRCDVDCGVTGAGPTQQFDGTGGSIINDSLLRSIRITKGVGAFAFQIANGCDFLGGTIVSDGTSTGADARFSATFSRFRGSLIQQLPASSGSISFNGSDILNATVEITSGPRGLTVNNTRMNGVNQANCYVKQTSVNAGAFSNIVESCEILANGKIDFADTGTGTSGNRVNYSKVTGATQGGTFGRILIDGTSDGVGVNNCVIRDGKLTITNALAGSLNSATSVYGIEVGEAATWSVVNPSNAASRQFRDMRLAPRAVFSSVNASGGPNFDVFGIDLANQCQLNMLGAQGGVTRDVKLEGQSVLNIDAGGGVQVWRQGQETIVNTGAFVHFWSIFELRNPLAVAAPTPFTLTAANVGKLRNASFDNFVGV